MSKSLILLCAATVCMSHAQTFTTLATPNGSNGSNPQGVLVQGVDGNLYGTASFAGPGEADGTVYKIATNGGLTTIYAFCSQENCPDGDDLPAGVIQATDGNLYGTTFGGGSSTLPGFGTVFQLTPGGTLTTLHSFGQTGGANPDAALLEGISGEFYGATRSNGTSPGCGTIFRITSSGTLTTVHRFSGPDGCGPQAPLVQAPNRVLYGITAFGGASTNCGTQGCGTIFQITPQGHLTSLYSFTSGADNGDPQGLVQAVDGNFYGTTPLGNTNNGTIFRITPQGSFTTLYTFALNDPNGSHPTALVAATDGNLYGSTWWGGGSNNCINGCGTIFRATPAGAVTKLHTFHGSDGNTPMAALLQATDGNFYGTTSDGTAIGGTVCKLSVGLGPFVKLLPRTGSVGASVQILGTDLTGATSVSFNGTPAAFTVTSPSVITATVPSGATSGPIERCSAAAPSLSCREALAQILEDTYEQQHQTKQHLRCPISVRCGRRVARTNLHPSC